MIVIAALVGAIAVASSHAPVAADPDAPLDAPLDDTARTLEADVETWAGFDSNANREPDGVLGSSPPGRVEPSLPAPLPKPDGLVQADAALAAELRRPGLVLRSDTLVGAKLFFTLDDERMIAGQERATVSTPLSAVPVAGAAWTTSLLAKARAQLDGQRTYALVDATSIADVPALSWLTLRAGAHGQAFHAFDEARFSSGYAGVLVGARAAHGPESAELLVDVGGRGYPFSSSNDLDPAAPGASAQLRSDGVVTGTLTLTSARTLYVSAGYTLLRDASDARGESFTRHRLTALVGTRLPADVDVVAEAALQLTQYDDGVSFGQAYFLAAFEQENQNVVAVTLARALWHDVSVVASLSFIANEFAVEGARFSRQTAAIGVRADL